MNLNFIEGRKIAKIVDDPKHKNINIFVSENEEEDNYGRSFDHLEIKKGQFQYIPDKERFRDTIFCAGSAGSGKSYWVSQYVKEYHSTYKNNTIYLISECKEDPVFDKLDYVKRIKIDDELLENPILYDEFDNCLVIYDDIDAINGKLGKYIYSLRDKHLKNSRKNHVSVISTNHTFTGTDLKAVLNESDVIVFFMANYNRSLKYLLENYVGLNKQSIKNLKKHKSRATAYIKSYPNIILQEKFICTLEYLENE
jgi:hypothetical protein